MFKNIFKSASFKTLSIFAGGNLLVSILGGLGGLLQARWLDPEVFGEFRKYGILIGYFAVGGVLVQDGLARQFPYLLGKGKKEEAFKVAAAAKWWYLCMAWALSIFFFGLTAHSLVKGDYRAVVGWTAQVICVWSVMYGAYLTLMYRTSTEFRQLSYNNLTTAISGFISLFFVKILGYWGLALRVIIMNTLRVFINRHYLPVRVKATWDRKRLFELSTISVPLSIPGYISTSLLTASISFMVLKNCGELGLGLYGVALTFQSLALTFTNALNQIFRVKVSGKFGESDNVFDCLSYITKPTMISVIAAFGLAVGLCVVIGPFIRLLLPKYVDSIPLIKILAVCLPLSAAGLPLTVFQAALWYKSVFMVAVVRFVVCMLMIYVLPKTLHFIAISFVVASFSGVAVGYVILICSKRKQRLASQTASA